MKNSIKRMAQLAFCLLAIITLTLSGCDLDKARGLFGPGSPHAQPQEPRVTFDLPPGWNWTDETHERAVKGAAPLPEMLETDQFGTMLSSWGFTKGTEEDAMAQTQSRQEQMLENCPKPCTVTPAYQELTIAGDTLYIAKDYNTTFLGPEHAFWVSEIGFPQGGKIFWFELIGDAELFQDELAIVITTIDYKE